MRSKLHCSIHSLARQYVAELVNHVPLTPRRKSKLENRRFHNLELVAVALKEIFDINIAEGLAPEVGDSPS